MDETGTNKLPLCTCGLTLGWPQRDPNCAVHRLAPAGTILSGVAAQGPVAPGCHKHWNGSVFYPAAIVVRDDQCPMPCIADVWNRGHHG